MGYFRKATIKDVAERASVSTTAISLYVSGQTQVCSAETAKRIERAVSALNYTPSSLTRGLRQRNSMTIGVCVTNPLNPLVGYGQGFFKQLWRGIVHQADIENYSLLHYPSGAWDGKRCDPFLDGRVDGLLLHDHEDIRPQELVSAGMPLVLLTRSRNIPIGCGCAHADESVTTNLAMTHLWDLGHRRIAYVAGPAGDRGSTRHEPQGVSRKMDDVAVTRLEGYINWMKEHKVYVPSHIVSSGDWVAPNASFLLEELLEAPLPPTAIFCANDTLALAIMEAAQSRGLRVPQDLSIVGVDNSPQSRENGASLTTVDIQLEEIGRESLRALLRLMRDETVDKYRVSLPVSTLIVRESTAELIGFRK